MKPRYLLACTAAELAAMDAEALVRTLRRRARQLYQARVTEQEEESWRASPKTVADVLVKAGLGEVMVLLEMSTLSSDARIDMLLVGSHPDAGELSVVAVENKQWSEAAVNPRTGRIVHRGATRDGSQHPVEQVWDYCRALDRNLPMLNGRFHGVVNLHNAETERIAGILPPAFKLRGEVRRVHMFGGDEAARDQFATFLSQVLMAENAATHVRDIDRAHARPSEELMLAVDQAVRRRSVFPLLDEQRETVDRVFRAVEEKFSEDNKQVFIISGGPGTGKTVLALELLGMLSRAGSAAVHASGSVAFAEALRRHVTGRRGEVEEVFTFFHQHRRRERNRLNVLICDEAHRLRKDSNLRFAPAESRSDVPQVHELINAARVPVFLLDPQQVVRRDEVGTPEVIWQAALDLGISEDRIHQITLGRQFRHSLCPDYVDWLEDLLGYGPAPRPWTHQGQFQLLLADSPQQMENYLRIQIALKNSARITAGYCWDWTKDYLPGGRLANDIAIDGWERPWNANTPNRRRNIPSRKTWATDQAGFEQVGCIYTAQNFDWDYTGVIMGYDYTWDGHRWIAKNNKDTGTHGTARAYTVRNIYRVLATRGKRGVVLYSTDAATKNLLADLKVPPLAPVLDNLRQQHPEISVAIPTRLRLHPVQESMF
ncbi:DUF2075 domain-containing protein [Microbispora rosea]|uniref:DUF2075 domain-containing protein n=1 Tax=Microbispora rosea TaxID=58117 RepID=UPI00378C98F3